MAADAFDSVQIKNRCDEPVGIMFDGKEIIWKAGQVRSIPAENAEFFINHSVVKWNPFTHEYVARLVVLGSGDPETPLTHEEANPKELLDRESMDPTHFDPETGEPLRAEYKELRGGGSRAEQVRDRIPLDHNDKTYEHAFDTAAPERLTPEA